MARSQEEKDLGIVMGVPEEAVLSAIAVEEIWGIGRQYSQWLHSLAITEALTLRELPEWKIQKKMGIVGIRLLRELNGISCLPLELAPKPKKRQDPASPTGPKGLAPRRARERLPRQVTCVSRSFRDPVKSLAQMKEAVATHTTSAVAKLRKQQQNTTAITIFILTSRFKNNLN